MNKSLIQNCHNFLEADILVRLSHPAIPILYDLEEDEHSITIIEEYIHGQSLDKYLLYHKSISQITLFQFAIQLCEVVNYLHSYKPYPILYQDMKPNHIIVCGNQIKLIDYGIAIFLTSRGNIFQKYGTKEYAPPEQYTNAPQDVKTDIYGVGIVLEELLSHSNLKYDLPMKYLVKRVTASNPKDRPDNIQWLQSRLEYLSQKSILINQKQRRGMRVFSVYRQRSGKHLLESIAVIGNQSGVGCTHIAVALTVYLRAMHESAYYTDEMQKQVLQHVMRNNPAFVEEDGIIYHDLFHGLPQYKETEKQRKPPNGIRVMDCGSDKEYLMKAKMVLYIVSGNLWQMDEISRDMLWLINHPHVYIICNHASVGTAKQYAKRYHTKVYAYPMEEDAFLMSAKKQKVFEKIFKKELSQI